MRFSKRFVCSASFLFITSIPAFSQTSTPTPAAKPKSSTSAKSKPVASPYDRTLLKPPLLKDTAPDTFQVKFETTRGDFTITVTRAWSPLGADRFYNLVKHHYYDGARVYRAVPNFVTQFGYSAYPVVSAAWEHATIQDDPHNQSNKKGTIVFATSGPNTRTTQVFINLKDNSFLDSQGFTPFGAVDSTGLNIVQMFYDQYGDSAGLDQGPIAKGGESYIATRWPKLDTIKSASLIGAAAEAPPAPTPAKPAPKVAPKPQQ